MKIEDVCVPCPNCFQLVDPMQLKDEGCDYCVVEEDLDDELHKYSGYTGDDGWIF